MNTRIKEIRKSLELSQTAFGEKIGISRDSIANIEGNRMEIKDVVIKAICREFSVNENWLRTGSGEMFIKKSKDEELAEFLADVQLEGEESFKHRLILGLANMSETGWDELEKFLDSISKKD